jgi:hypothetical protein
MSYIINNSRGNVVAIIADGTVNTTATDLALVGRAVTNYGTSENENYVYLLENFANSTAPLQPILGQLWYNSNTDIISAYSGANTWVNLASVVSPAFTGIPTAPTAANGTSTTQIATTAYVQNQLSSSSGITTVGNITGGNLLTGGLVSATGNVTGGNITTAGLITGGNITTAGLITVAGNVTGGNILSSGLVSVTGNIIGGNISTVSYSGTTLLVTGNITGGNINTSGSVSATGNVIGANFIGNVIPPAGGAVSTTGNVTGGNILTSGLASVTGNIQGGNLRTAGLISATGNITGGNIRTSGVISATGNITSAGTVIADTVIANNVITTGSTSAFRLPNLNQTQINALTPQNGDLVYNTTDNLSQVYQNGSWNNFTISYYS